MIFPGHIFLKAESHRPRRRSATDRLL